ncbi:uncharacterized protein DC041_0003271 [Schistosoma bovis]|uniref:C2H2-type domain-containing protein n=1 Tax=Schistosoma bovis TaxID=6184 RepID=A0A430QE65_SCHBO|nr:uncharacterized protein DC041_0003271 [Schistosoma bovis]
MEEEGELNKGPLDNSLASSCQNDITESLMTQVVTLCILDPIPINIRIAQDIQEFLCKGSVLCVIIILKYIMLNSFNLLSSHVIYYEVSSIVFVVGIKDYECSLCFKKFARNEHYNRHMNDVHTQQSGLFASGSVLLFNQSEDTINNNNDHSTSNHLSHNYEQQQSLQIDQVDSNSIDVAGPGLYVEVEFNADETEAGKSIREEHQCPACEKRFYRKYHLNRHIAEVHRVFGSCVLAGKPFLCPYCRREFAREWSYHQHLQKYHDGKY